MNPFGKYSGLKINRAFYSREQLLSTGFRGENLPTALLAALDFAAALFSESDFVEVQTSGSTGSPKLLKTHKKAIETSAVATNTFFNLSKNSTAAIALPIRYIAGKMMVARAIVGEYDLIVFEPSSQAVPRFPVDFMPVVPMQIEACLAQNPERIQNVKTYLIGGGRASDLLRKKIGEAKIDAWYSFGMTETLSHFALAKAELSSEPEYRPLPGVAIRANENGQLEINWPGITRGFIQTHDLVKMTNDGFIWLGRSDNLINSGGVKIIPERVERQVANYLHTPFFIAGLPHPKLGEEVVLFTESKIVELPPIPWDSPYHKPRKIVYIADFDRTLSGKIRRKATVERWSRNG